MTGPVLPMLQTPTANTPPASAARAAIQGKLHAAAQALEGMFVRQLFTAMRATVPTSDDDGPGATMFTSMLDDEMADRAATHMSRGLGDAIYRQLSAQLPKEDQ